MEDKDKKKYIDIILQEIFELEESVIDKTREPELRDSITRAVNGDMPQKHLVINIDETAVIYILTNLRIIVIDIDATKIQSSSFVLNAITNIQTEKLLEEGTVETRIVFQNNSFGLIYPIDDKKASDFFQAIDNLRVKNR